MAEADSTRWNDIERVEERARMMSASVFRRLNLVYFLKRLRKI